MNIAILGNSKQNGRLQSMLEAEGFSVSRWENITDIRGLKGEAGAYTLRTSQGLCETGCVIVTQELCAEPAVCDDLPAQVLPWIPLASFDEKALPDKKAPVVFLLDQAGDSPAYETRLALSTAIALGKKKKRVLVLSRFVRTAEPGLEEAYRQARNAGVAFHKYDALTVEFDGETDLFRIEAGGIEPVYVETRNLIVAETAGNNPALDGLKTALRIKNAGTGMLPEAFYAYPTFTGRKGVFSLSGFANEFTDEEVSFFVRSVVNAIRRVETEPAPTQYATVNPVKCAFCYNCYRACRHGALEPDPAQSAMRCLPNNCQACGVCVSVCPASAIELVGQQSASSIGGVKVFCCENSGEIALKRLQKEGVVAKDSVSAQAVPCGGRITAQALLSALEDHASVLVLLCPDGACKHEEGNLRAKAQVERAKTLLRAIGEDETRINVLQAAHAAQRAVLEALNESTERMEG